MFPVIPLAIFAFASFTAAAPITTQNGILPLTEAVMHAKYELPLNWKHDQQNTNDFHKMVESAITQVLYQQNNLARRQNEVPFELETMFRGLFDKVVSYVIQVTPLHEIVEGNYDILYGFLTGKISEAIAGFAQAPPVGLPQANPSATGKDGASASAPTAPFDLLGGAISAISSSPFDLVGQSDNEAPPAFPNNLNLGESTTEDKSNKSDKKDEDNDSDEDKYEEDDEDIDFENEEEDKEEYECDEDYEDYKKKWKDHWKKHHKGHHGK